MDGTTYHSKAVGNVENVLFIAKDNIEDHGQQVSLRKGNNIRVELEKSIIYRKRYYWLFVYFDS